MEQEVSLDHIMDTLRIQKPEYFNHMGKATYRDTSQMGYFSIHVDVSGGSSSYQEQDSLDFLRYSIPDLPLPSVSDPDYFHFLYLNSSDSSYDKKYDAHPYVQISSYRDQVWMSKEDFTNLADKRFIPLPDSFIPFARGMTVLGENWMGLNMEKYDSDTVLHEAVHCEWEYRTRLIVEHMKDIKKPKYFK